MLFACVYKVYVGFSSRRFISDLREAFIDGLVNTTPHFNSVSNYIANPELARALHKKLGSDTRDGRLLLNKPPLLVVACNLCAKPLDD
jgi:hypothetical protein